jgi:hypothetical protein
MTISKNQAIAAAEFLRSVRSTWDPELTAATIAELAEKYPYPDVIKAALKVAVNPDNKSPLAMKWTENLPVVSDIQTGSYSHEPRCAICLLRKTRCRYMAERTGDGHLFTAEDDTQPDPDVSAADWVDMIKDLVRRPA